jgi:hypothetical protein
MPKDTTKVPSATTPADNDYDPHCGSYDPCYSGDLDERETDYEERDAKVDATRAEFAKPVSGKYPTD